jgi:hypothetical protein
MATKKREAHTPAAPKTKTVGKAVASFPDPPDKLNADALAELALHPESMAAVAMESFTKPFGKLDVGSLSIVLSSQTKEVQSGDMKQAEAMLFGQAHALQAIFMSLARRANAQDYMKNMETYLRMALKAQNQCRMTLETLATIKNPPVVFAKQANINNGGQQQVNNGAGPGQGVNPAPARAFSGAGAHAANSKPDQPELLEASDGQRLDTRATSKAGGADPQLAPVGKVHRAAHR